MHLIQPPEPFAKRQQCDACEKSLAAQSVQDMNPEDVWVILTFAGPSDGQQVQAGMRKSK